jgi:hypothetical protein
MKSEPGHRCRRMWKRFRPHCNCRETETVCAGLHSCAVHLQKNAEQLPKLYCRRSFAGSSHLRRHSRLPPPRRGKAAVLNLSSKESQRNQEHATGECIAWYCSEPRGGSRIKPSIPACWFRIRPGTSLSAVCRISVRRIRPRTAFPVTIFGSGYEGRHSSCRAISSAYARFRFYYHGHGAPGLPKPYAVPPLVPRRN